MATPTNTYNSLVDLFLAHIPKGADDNRDLYEELLDIHNAIEAILIELNGMNKDFLLEVAKGNVPGHELLFVIGIANDIGPAFTDLWDVGGLRTPITAAESWELVSANAADTAAGTGARLVQLRSLDADYNLQTNFIITNGGTVAIPGTHIATRVMQVIGAGTNNVNVGDLTIQVAGGGAIRQRVVADEGRSNNSFFTVPAGKCAFPIQFSTFSPKGEDATARPRINIGGLGAVETSNGFIPTYQSSFRNTVLATAMLPEKSTIWFQAKTSGTPPFTIIAHAEYLIVDDEFVGQATAMAEMAVF